MVNVDLDTKDQLKETKGEGGTKRWLKLELSHDSTADRIIGMIYQVQVGEFYTSFLIGPRISKPKSREKIDGQNTEASTSGQLIDILTGSTELHSHANIKVHRATFTCK